MKETETWQNLNDRNSESELSILPEPPSYHEFSRLDLSKLKNLGVKHTEGYKEPEKTKFNNEISDVKRSLELVAKPGTPYTPELKIK